MDSNHKQLRENFFGGHNGSSFAEVIVVTSINQWAHFLLMAVLSLFPALTQPKFDRKLIDFDE